VFYLAGTWLGSGGGQDPWTGGGPLALLWLVSLFVAAVGLLRRVVDAAGTGGDRHLQ
jgi:hypothetical protein